jgi:peptidyl-tRNA hydrolase
MTVCNIITRSDSDFVRSFLYKTIAGVAIDLTGSKLEMMLRTEADRPTVYIDLSTDNGKIVLTVGTTGEFKITIPFAELEILPPDEYAHSLIRIRPDGIREEMWHGTLTHAIGPTR